MGGTGLLSAETLVAGLAYGRHLWFGTQSDVGQLTERAAGEHGTELHVLAPA